MPKMKYQPSSYDLTISGHDVMLQNISSKKGKAPKKNLTPKIEWNFTQRCSMSNFE